MSGALCVAFAKRFTVRVDGIVLPLSSRAIPRLLRPYDACVPSPILVSTTLASGNRAVISSVPPRAST